MYRYGKGPVHYSYFNCIGNEIKLLACPHSFPESYCHSHYYDAGVICRGSNILSFIVFLLHSFVFLIESCRNNEIQLVGDHRYSHFGRVEVCINGIWGKICNEFWSDHDASVVCRELGFSVYGKMLPM